MSTAERIKTARKAAGLTQTELAAKIGLKFSVVSKYETGRVVNLKREIIDDIAKACNVRPSWLMCLDDEDPATNSDGVQSKYVILEKDKRLLEWFRSLSPEKQKAILISQDAPEDLF